MVILEFLQDELANAVVARAIRDRAFIAPPQTQEGRLDRCMGDFFASPYGQREQESISSPSTSTLLPSSRASTGIWRQSHVFLSNLYNIRLEQSNRVDQLEDAK